MQSNLSSGVPFAGILTRVLLLAGIPLLLLAAVTITLAVGDWYRAQDARELERRVELLDGLVALRRALFVERTQYEVSTWSADLALDESAARDAFGVDATADRLVLREATDVALAGLPPEARPFDQPDVVRVRQLIDAGGIAPSVVAGRFDGLDRTLREALAGHVDDVRSRTGSTQSVDLLRAVTTLEDAIVALHSSSDLVSDLGALWYAPSFEQRLAQSRLAMTYARFEDVARRIERSEGPVGGAWIEATRRGRPFDAAIQDALRGLASPLQFETPQVDAVATLGAGYQMAAIATTIPTIASDEVRAVSDALAMKAERAMVGSGTLAGLSLLGSLVAAFLIGRSIVAPVRRLTRQAKAISAGDLDVAALPGGGPPELALASAAFNELVANLRLLDRKARALAECDFESDALMEPLPGRLGHSLARSVHVLSGSIVERERLQSTLAYQATHDALTQVPNRAAALDALEGATYRANRSGRMLGVVFIDLNDFKRINDTLGHAAGDSVLREVAARLTRLVPPGDTVARLGGDEFVVIAEDLEDSVEAMTFVERVLAGLADPISSDGLSLSVTASAGVALSRGQEDEPLDLLRRADLALYRAKRGGAGNLGLYDAALERHLADTADVEDALKATLRRDGDELHLQYQPIVSAATSDLVSVEALLRWDRPGHGLVPPDSFIPVAEQSDLILEVDRWVLRRATQQLVDWSRYPSWADISISVNVSGRHVLHAGFVADVRAALAESGLDPSRLVIEITETVLVADVERAAAQLAAVRALGVRIAIDDFGTGFTSIAHLRQLPIDEIKIDRSLVSGIAESGNRSLFQLVRDLAEHLGLPTVAEGVESKDQFEILRSLGCTTVQGYYFAKPLAPNALLGWASARLHQQAA